MTCITIYHDIPSIYYNIEAAYIRSKSLHVRKNLSQGISMSNPHIQLEASWQPGDSL